jgi:hypothetical protein
MWIKKLSFELKIKISILKLVMQILELLFEFES